MATTGPPARRYAISFDGTEASDCSPAVGRRKASAAARRSAVFSAGHGE
jgi:hypothetical protein